MGIPDDRWRRGLAVRLTPNGSCDAIDGMKTLADGRPALMVRVRAVPANGEANMALIRLLAKAVGVPPRDVALVSGATGRHQAASDFGQRPNAPCGAGENCAAALRLVRLKSAVRTWHADMGTRIIDGKTIAAGSARQGYGPPCIVCAATVASCPASRSCWSATTPPAKSMSQQIARRSRNAGMRSFDRKLAGTTAAKPSCLR